MKSLMAPLACGAVAAVLLYGLLWAAERKVPPPEDPWLDTWVADGLSAQFRSTSDAPGSDVLPGDARELFRGEQLAGTVLRNYVIKNTSVQVIRLPKAGLVPEIPDGRVIGRRFKPDGNLIHVCRVGRSLVFVGFQGKGIAFVWQMRTAKQDIEQIFDGFEETVRRYP